MFLFFSLVLFFNWDFFLFEGAMIQKGARILKQSWNSDCLIEENTLRYLDCPDSTHDARYEWPLHIFTCRSLLIVGDSNDKAV